MNKNTLYAFAEQTTPPVLFSAFKKSFLYRWTRALASKVVKSAYAPDWHVVTKGRLKGRKLYFDPKGAWQSEMLDGTYDDFFFNYVEKLNLEGKVIYDIGTHIGYNSIYFADLVGPKGKVYAFEPNIFNKERFEYILTENKDLEKIIEIHGVAISDKIGKEEFIFSSTIENGTSSGSFLDSAHTHMDKESYETHGGWKRVSVPTVSLDTISTLGITDAPYLLKIDIEGAEYLALEGSKALLREHKPIILIEIHSIFNMLKAVEIFGELHYKIELLREEKDGRCFISATPKH